MAEKKEKEGEEEKKSLPQMVPKHHWECNKEWYSRKEVEKSQEEFPWKDDKYKLRWKNSCDMSHSWNGIVRLLPGQVELMHTHTTPMIYYILQCVTIPSKCPHGITNDTNEEVVIAWIYLSFDVPAPDKNYNWEFLEDPFAD